MIRKKLSIKSVFLAGVALYITLMFSSCATRSYPFAELYNQNMVTWNEPAPKGMIKIPRGHIVLGNLINDSIYADDTTKKGVSVDAFWMDKTEVTNRQYRAFVYYVRDSIIRQRLADPSYGGEDGYIITEDKDGNPIAPRINWAKPIPKITKANDDELRAINSVYRTNPITGKRTLDPNQLYYRYQTYDRHAAILYADYLSPRPVYNSKWHKKYREPIMIVKDTAYIDIDGKVIRKSITKRLTSYQDLVSTYIVPVYPDESVWVTDFPNSRNEQYAENYFEHPAYDNYPVVGVTWNQARAFCAWRTQQYMQNIKVPKGQQIEPFRLPTMAEWEYAARAGNSEQSFPWPCKEKKQGKRCRRANYKGVFGDYTTDNSLITSPVKSYPPNNFGLYDMAGNVAEWTSTPWSMSLVNNLSDLNAQDYTPVQYNEPHILTRKVVMGGSWKDIARYIRSTQISNEYQDVPRSYIGFRCVKSAIDFVK